MAIKTTSVKVDEDLWKLAKKKGYKLQDIINQALLSVCMVELDSEELSELNKQLEDLENELEILERSKEEKIDEIIKEFDVKIMALKVKIKSVKNKIEVETENQRIRKEKQYHQDKLLEMFNIFISGVLLSDEKLVELMENYSKEFDVDIIRVNQIVEKSQYKLKTDLPDYASEIVEEYYSKK